MSETLATSSPPRTLATTNMNWKFCFLFKQRALWFMARVLPLEPNGHGFDSCSRQTFFSSFFFLEWDIAVAIPRHVIMCYTTAPSRKALLLLPVGVCIFEITQKKISSSSNFFEKNSIPRTSILVTWNKKTKFFFFQNLKFCKTEFQDFFSSAFINTPLCV